MAKLPLGLKMRRKYEHKPQANTFEPRIKFASNRKKLAVKIIAENPTISTKKALEMAGYSKSTANTSPLVTKTRSWNELMDLYLPDDLLATKHKEFLTTPKTIRKFARGELLETVEEVSPQATKALDMAYKLKGRYQDIAIDKALIVNVSAPIAEKYKIPIIERYNTSPDVRNEPTTNEPSKDDTSII